MILSKKASRRIPPLLRFWFYKGHLILVVLFIVYLRINHEFAAKDAEIAYLKGTIDSQAQLVSMAFGGGSGRRVDHLEVEVTSYNPTRGQGWGSGAVTYDGNHAAPGVIAVSHDLYHRKGLKMGSKVVLGKYGTFVVGDLMHSRWKNRVDIISFIPGWSKKFGKKRAVLYYRKEA